MRGAALPGQHFSRGGRAGDGALDRFLDGAVVVVLDLLVVLGEPVNEYADADEQVVGFGGRNDFGN